MTVGESIISWLYTFGNIEVSAIIETDQLDSEAGSYALYKEPTKTVTPYLDGSLDVTERYYFLVRQNSKLNASRVENQAWLESLERWVTTQNRARNLPVLDDERDCWGVGVAVSAYMAEAETDTAAYQMSVEIYYIEKRR